MLVFVAPNQDIGVTSTLGLDAAAGVFSGDWCRLVTFILGGWRDAAHTHSRIHKAASEVMVTAVYCLEIPIDTAGHDVAVATTNVSILLAGIGLRQLVCLRGIERVLFLGWIVYQHRELLTLGRGPSAAVLTLVGEGGHRLIDRYTLGAAREPG